MSLQVCRRCGEALPWAKKKAAKAAPVPKVAQASVAQRQLSAPAIDWGLWAVGVFSFCMPLIGYFLYRSYSENGDDKAAAAALGALAGVMAVVLRVALRVTMS